MRTIQQAGLDRRRFMMFAAACGLTPLGVAPSASAQDVAVRIPAAEVMRSVKSRREPDYPDMARSMGVEGDVVLDAVIDVQGRVDNVTRVDGHPVLAQAATQALEGWKFDPIKVNGTPRRVVSRFGFSFKR